VDLVEIAVGVALISFLSVLVFGLVTGRIPWRANGCCCPADPAQDRRMTAAGIDDA
jgi:hypothetical protein